ncbi:ABC transporter ATP-binding protein [Perkinsela sp. CCAP 1560/4]|nr:ABC transporter ATP-binding protein [Perkinsela sp. CCAP 1560/4]|eukprot:KNH04504.1 ABC transporter ATP-binding protein [Perkinsela sp. CCAP 1560/4]
MSTFPDAFGKLAKLTRSSKLDWARCILRRLHKKAVKPAVPKQLCSILMSRVPGALTKGWKTPGFPTTGYQSSHHEKVAFHGFSNQPIVIKTWDFHRLWEITQLWCPSQAITEHRELSHTAWKKRKTECACIFMFPLRHQR